MTVSYQLLPSHLAKPATAVLAEALMVEPGFAFIVPDAPTRRRAMQHIIAGMLGTALRAGTVWAALEHNRVLGAAILAAPGAYPPGIGEHIRTLPRYLALFQFGIATARRLEAFDRNAHTYMPQDPCWYLQALGVDPATQGQGIGSGLLRSLLEHIGPEACYLETATEANVRLYERYGFVVLDPAAQLTPDNGPTHWTMLRPAP